MIVAEQNKIIGIDVDGVLRNFCDSLMSVVTMYYPEYLKDGVTEITDWQLENNFNCSKKEGYKEINSSSFNCLRNSAIFDIIIFFIQRWIYL